MRQALKCSGRRSLPRQGEVVWEQAPSTSAPQDVEDGVQYLARLVSSGTSARFGSGNERLEDLPYVIAEVGMVGASVGHGKATPSRFGSRILLLQAPSQTPSHSLERLSGKSLCGSNGAFFGSAKRPKRCHFAPLCRLKGPRNGARSDFPDTLWKGNSPKLACSTVQSFSCARLCRLSLQCTRHRCQGGNRWTLQIPTPR